MIKSRKVFFALLFFVAAALALNGCGAEKVADAPEGDQEDLQTQKVPVGGDGSYTDIGANGVAIMLENKDFPLINVHVPYEGEIGKTDLFIPYDQVESNLDKLPVDKSAKLILYCRSGSMSDTAARKLVDLGYTNVWSLDGGMIGWEQAGHPLLNRDR